MEIQNLLPESSFIPFTAVRLKNASVVYANLPLFQSYGYFKNHTDSTTELWDAVLNEFAYAVPSEMEQDSDYITNDAREFLAERYGGVGILANGGGARCGLTGPFQVKGIGLTPLGGVGVHFWYRHGGLPLKEAIVDSLLGEAAHYALPYGSSRVVAIIDTGTMVWQRTYEHSDPEQDGRFQVRRGLLVRESGIRPAHFSRAFYFKPSAEVKLKYPHDFQRVAESVPLLPTLMKVVEHEAWPDATRYRVAIENMMTRSAVQLATSKMKRLMHGSLTQSNFLISGGWIDLGTATAVQHYGDVVTTANQPTYWQEHTLFQKTCEDLCFYVNKFVADEHGFLNGTAVFQNFMNVYNKYLARTALALTGIPTFILNRLTENGQVNQLGELFVRIAIAEQPQPAQIYCFYQEFDWEAHRLRSVLNELYVAYWHNGGVAPINLPFTKDMNDALWAAYCALCLAAETLAKEKNILKIDLSRSIGFDMMRRGLTPKILNRDQVMHKLHAWIESESDSQPLNSRVDKLFREETYLIQLHMKEPEDGAIPLYMGESATIYWSANSGSFILELNHDTPYWEKTSSTTSKLFFLDPLMKRFSFTKRYDESWAVIYPCNDINDFDDFHDSVIEFEHEKSLSLHELFPDWQRLRQNYRAAFSGESLPTDIYN